jgi:hypothetical protein
LAAGSYKKRPNYQSVMPDYQLVPRNKNIQANAIKSSRDNFAIVIGTDGVAAIKPLDDDWLKAKNPTRDNTMRYRIIWSLRGGPVDAETLSFRLGFRDGSGGTSGMKGDTENIFGEIANRIGTVVDLYVAQGAVDRAKLITRKSNAPEEKENDLESTTSVVFDKFKHVFTIMLNSTLGNIQQRASRLSQAGNFDQSRELISAGSKIQSMLTALDTDVPNYDSPMISPLKKIVRKQISQMTSDKSEEEKQEILDNLSTGRSNQLKDILYAVKQDLYKIHQIY